MAIARWLVVELPILSPLIRGFIPFGLSSYPPLSFFCRFHIIAGKREPVDSPRSIMLQRGVIYLGFLQ